MEISRSWLSSLVFVGVLMGLATSSGAYVFYVGGRDGWVSNPSETYDSWAGRNRFQVNDTLVFRYSNGTDSVLVVTKQDYDGCNSVPPPSPSSSSIVSESRVTLGLIAMILGGALLH
ncbi:hypothetical protein OPV22_014201 [Ensete ventricosum]|uniref:Phytocyanin domain-containing protein n=1 Tax=Ensete ventricosum TaxID=4639 RepID=A0AAV8R136_ENSVE|nr:hypothetical protein OPV22_014201 [Ensete ventricosum]